MSIPAPTHRRNGPIRKKWPGVLVKRPHGLLRRRTLFTIAGAILLASAITSPLSFLFLLCSDTLVALVIAAFLVVAVIRVLVPVFLRAKGIAWHTRSAAPPFLFVALVAVDLVVLAVDRFACEVFGTSPFMSSAVATYVLIALELILIALWR